MLTLSVHEEQRKSIKDIQGKISGTAERTDEII